MASTRPTPARERALADLFSQRWRVTITNRQAREINPANDFSSLIHCLCCGGKALVFTNVGHVTDASGWWLSGLWARTGAKVSATSRLEPRAAGVEAKRFSCTFRAAVLQQTAGNVGGFNKNWVSLCVVNQLRFFFLCWLSFTEFIYEERANCKQLFYRIRCRCFTFHNNTQHLFVGANARRGQFAFCTNRLKCSRWEVTGEAQHTCGFTPVHPYVT